MKWHSWTQLLSKSTLVPSKVAQPTSSLGGAFASSAKDGFALCTSTQRGIAVMPSPSPNGFKVPKSRAKPRKTRRKAC